MTETLSPEATAQFRNAQKKRSRVVVVVILIWIVGIFALTLVKGQMAVAQREAQTNAQTAPHAE
jgi:flagellar basal body-associated protein FliL